MRMKDDDIQKKLVDLESAILKEARPLNSAQIKTVDTGGHLSKSSDQELIVSKSI